MKIEDFINENGRVISTKTKESYFKKWFPFELELINRKATELNIENRTFSEKMYHFLLNLDSPILCKHCHSGVPPYRGLANGYLNYCSYRCSNNAEDVKEFKRKTSFIKYGVDNPSKSDSVISKIKNTYKNNFLDNKDAMEDLRARIKATTLERYNDTNAFGRNSSLRHSFDKKREEEFREKYKGLKIIELDPQKWGICRIECDICGEEYEISKWNLHQRWQVGTNYCTKCNPIGADIETHIESFIKNILDEYTFKYQLKNRRILSNYELDFVLDDFNIAIETDGIYWHSSNYKPMNYHLDKTNRCLEKNINLLHIFEDEILNKPEIVRSRILSILGKYKNNIWARKCEIREINSYDSSIFLNDNHLQGACGASIRLGLFFNNELVSMMTFSKNRKSLGSSSRENEWELARFCNKLNTRVIGGASKLLKYFIKKYHPNKITSFCDLRWSPNTDFYSKLGFKFIKNTPPNYWYYANNSYKKYHRFNFRKDILIKQGYDPNKTEFEIMAERKFLRVYDCGNSKWELYF